MGENFHGAALIYLVGLVIGIWTLKKTIAPENVAINLLLFGTVTMFAYAIVHVADTWLLSHLASPTVRSLTAGALGGAALVGLWQLWLSLFQKDKRKD